MRLAMDLLPRYFAEQPLAAPDDRRAVLFDLARKVMSRARLGNALELAKGLMLADPSDFDRDPLLLN